jgi:hypothetical protein
MLTLNINYEVLPDRLVTIKLPETFCPGRHELVIVLEENAVNENFTDTNAKKLTQFAGTVTAFNGVDVLNTRKKCTRIGIDQAL